MAKTTILVVDDTPDNLTVLTNLLKEHWKVKIALNGEKALQIAQASPPPDLVLLDIMMPGMDGFEVCTRLKAGATTAAIPVIFLSGKSEQADRDRGLALGAAGYIAKPIEAAEVLATVREFMAD